MSSFTFDTAGRYGRRFALTVSGGVVEMPDAAAAPAAAASPAPGPAGPDEPAEPDDAPADEDGPRAKVLERPARSAPRPAGRRAQTK